MWQPLRLLRFPFVASLSTSDFAASQVLGITATFPVKSVSNPGGPTTRSPIPKSPISFDFVSPATYNLAILYPIPLFVCVWTQSHRVLWGMLITLLALSAIAHLFGGPRVDVSDTLLLRGRLLAAIGLVILTTLLSLWIVPRSTAHR